LLSAWIRTENVAHSNDTYDRGANVAIQFTSPTLQFPTYSQPFFGTSGRWQQVFIQFATTETIDADVVLEVGGYSALTTGTAWFDDIQLQKLD
jgi:hypothetical protein